MKRERDGLCSFERENMMVCAALKAIEEADGRTYLESKLPNGSMLLEVGCHHSLLSHMHCLLIASIRVQVRQVNGEVLLMVSKST